MVLSPDQGSLGPSSEYCTLIPSNVTPSSHSHSSLVIMSRGDLLIGHREQSSKVKSPVKLLAPPHGPWLDSWYPYLIANLEHGASPGTENTCDVPCYAAVLCFTLHQSCLSLSLVSTLTRRDQGPDVEMRECWHGPGPPQTDQGRLSISKNIPALAHADTGWQHRPPPGQGRSKGKVSVKRNHNRNNNQHHFPTKQHMFEWMCR